MSLEVIGVVAHIVMSLAFHLAEHQEKLDPHASVSYVIGNDLRAGTPSDESLGGKAPGVIMYDDTGERLGKEYPSEHCSEGDVHCTTTVYTTEAVTYTLFSGRGDSICIAWTGLTWASGRRSYGFHPGNWAEACDQPQYHARKQKGSWYFANTQVPGIDNPADVHCLWLSDFKNQHGYNTGFQVYWPEFSLDERPMRDLDYYCKNPVAFNFRAEYSPINLMPYRHDLDGFTRNTSKPELPAAKHGAGSEHSAAQDHHNHLARHFAQFTHVVKSHSPRHTASQLCDRDRNAAGPSFVSYTEEQFCYMPTKTIYSFCDAEQNGPCWNDTIHRVVANGDIVKRTLSNGPTSHDDIPDLSHIQKAIIWGEELK